MPCAQKEFIAIQQTIKKPPDHLDDENNNCHRDAEGLEESSRNVRLILRSIDKTVHQVLRLSDLIQDSLHNNTTTTSSTSRQSLASAIIESVMTHLAMPAAVMPVMFPGISNAVSYFYSLFYSTNKPSCYTLTVRGVRNQSIPLYFV